MKFLFLTFEGIDSTIFNSQVLMHAKTLAEQDIQVDILTFNTNHKTRMLSLLNLGIINKDHPKINIELRYGVNIFNPFAIIYNSFSFIFFLIKNGHKYDFIHARADYSTYIACLTKFIHKKKVIWDCRGDSIGELRETLLSKNIFINKLGNFYLIPINKFQLFVISKLADAAIFVSKALCNQKTLSLTTKTVCILPCPVNENLFFFSEFLRKSKRLEFGFNEDNNIFLYSGSMAFYQSIDMHIAFYTKILSISNNFIIFATSDQILAKKTFSNFPKDRFLIVNVPYFEMNSYLNLADFALLLREDKIYNNVASPTKFGEYCLSGLKVIMNDTVQQAVEISNLIGNHLNWKEPNYNRFKDNDRELIAMKAIDIYSRNSLNKKYILFYNQVINL